DELKDSYYTLSSLINNHYDCIFIDYHLQNQDCLKLIHKINASAIKVPLVILINSGNEAIAGDCIKAGASEYLIKCTLSSQTIAQILRSAIRIHRTQMQLELVNQQLKESREELAKQQQQIQQQKLAILEISRLKSLFLATISHELRTPMNAIIGFSQILLRPKFGNLTNQQMDMIERILNNGKKLLMLFDEILDFSQIQAGKLELKPEIFDLSEVVSNTVKEIHSLAEAKNLSLLVKGELNNKLVFNDMGRLRQILMNLLSNAIKFTESGNIFVEIKEIHQNRVIIAVADTGIGIDTQDFKNIFTAFHQIDQGISRKYSGAGLGLAIVDSLVRMMGGKIYIKSQLGVGSMFRIELPRKINLIADLGNIVSRTRQHH
ncbi:MAG: ATP-binding protein, partial [Dolichospermum sp.]